MADSEDVWVDSIEKYGEIVEQKPDDDPRWVEAKPGERVRHLYLDPKLNQGAFGGQKKESHSKIIEKMKKQLRDASADDKPEIRTKLIDQASSLMRSHSYHGRNTIMKEVMAFRREYIEKERFSQHHDPRNSYILEREKNEKRKENGFEKPKESKRPAQAMTSSLATNAKPPPQISQQHQLLLESDSATLDKDELIIPINEDRLWNNKKRGHQLIYDNRPKESPVSNQPVLSNTHCSVCDVYFCGEIPAKQHYAGQKHLKKYKKLEMEGGGFTQSSAVLSKPEILPKKVGMNLEYCELCELKLSPNPIVAAQHYSSRGHLKFLKIDADSPGLPGKSSLQRQDEARRYTGTWVDQIQVCDIPQWGRPRFNRMGHRIKLKGCGNGPGQQPIPGELENECRFCDTNFADPRQAVNHYMGKKHQTRLLQTGCQAPRGATESAPISLRPGQQAQKITLGFTR